MDKMSFDEFKEKVYETLRSRYPDKLIDKQDILKNNDTPQTGITIRDKGQNVAAVVYMESFYFDQYLEGREFEEIVDMIKALSDENNCKIEKDKITTTFTFDNIKDKIVPVLVNKVGNEKRLEHLVNRDFFEFSIVYKAVLGKYKEDGDATVLIRDEMLKMWDVTAEEIHELAMKNAPTLRPAEYKEIQTVIKELAKEKSWMLPDLPETDFMYVASNTIGFEGASVILYDGFLQRVYKELGSGFYILPSSVDEVILLKGQEENEATYNIIKLIREVNTTNLEYPKILGWMPMYFDGTELRVEVPTYKI